MSKVYINMQISGLVSAAALASFIGQVEQDGPNSATLIRQPDERDEPEQPVAQEKLKASRTTKPKAEEPPAEQEDASEDGVPSIDDVKAAAQSLVAANGREALAEMLGEYDAKNLSSIPEGKRAEFIAAIETKIAK